VAVAMVRPLVDTVAAKGFACSFAMGLDGKRALAAVEAHKKKPTASSYEKASHATTPWFALEADGLAESALVLDSVMQLAEGTAAYDLGKGAKWPAGTKAWKAPDGSVLAAMPEAGALLVLFAADGALVVEKLKTFAGLSAARMKVADTTRDAFRDTPAAVFVATDRLGDVTGLELDEDSLFGTLKTLREDAKRKEIPVQIPMTMRMRAASEATAWQGSLRLDARYPVKALQAISKGAKKLAAGAPIGL